MGRCGKMGKKLLITAWLGFFRFILLDFLNSLCSFEIKFFYCSFPQSFSSTTVSFRFILQGSDNFTVGVGLSIASPTSHYSSRYMADQVRPTKVFLEKSFSLFWRDAIYLLEINEFFERLLSLEFFLVY